VDERPFASPEYELHALSRFRLELSTEEFAARFAHEFALFNYDRFRYRTLGMTGWVDSLATFFLSDGLPARLRSAREKYLTPEEIAEVEAYERDPF
jgi:hypothetical protein